MSGDSSFLARLKRRAQDQMLADNNVSGITQILAAGMLALGCAIAQDRSPERHVPEIRAEMKAKYPDGFSESPLCQRAKAEPAQRYIHFRKTGPESLERSLSDLMRMSDEVILTGGIANVADALSPSGEDAVVYLDVRVLRSWKGHHKPGDPITFAFPTTTITCGPHWYAGTFTGSDELRASENWRLPWQSNPNGPFILFLRQGGPGLVDGLTPTGGDGTQGIFVVRATNIRDPHSALNACFRANYYPTTCTDTGPLNPEVPGCHFPVQEQKIEGENIAKCAAALSTSQEQITTGYQRTDENVNPTVNKKDSDQLRQAYTGVPISEFLTRVQSLADSSTRTEQAGNGK